MLSFRVIRVQRVPSFASIFRIRKAVFMALVRVEKLDSVKNVPLRSASLRSGEEDKYSHIVSVLACQTGKLDKNFRILRALNAGASAF